MITLDEMKKKWEEVYDLPTAVAIFIENEEFVGTDPYYRDLNKALWDMLGRALAAEKEKQTPQNISDNVVAMPRSNYGCSCDPTSNDPNAGLTAMLESMSRDARSGHLRSVFATGFNSDGTTFMANYNVHPENYFAIVGALETLKTEFIKNNTLKVG